MTTALVNPPTTAPDPAPADGRGSAPAWLLLVLLLVTNGPLFLCMPLTDDAVMYDLQALNLLQGGVLYRDIFEPNLPGIVWLHATIRSLGGTSSVVLRAADIGFLAVTLLLLRGLLKSSGVPRISLAWFALISTFFYFSMSEWCHCQRDTWLLCPALGALTLRRNQVDRLRQGQWDAYRTAICSVCEGVVWGAGVWIKPVVVIPAAACWLTSVWQIRNSRAAVVDFVGLLTGGLLAGGLGMLWLLQSGSWPFFVETLIEWNPRYMIAGREQWTALSFLRMIYRFFPWQFVHLVGVPVALVVMPRGLRRLRTGNRNRNPRPDDNDRSAAVTARMLGGGQKPGSDSAAVAQSLVAVFYLSWLVQSYCMQHLFDYVHAPGVLLGLAQLAEIANKSKVWKAVAVGFLVLALLSSPVLRSHRLACWAACLRSGSTPEIRHRLQLLPTTRWLDLVQVATFLRGLDVRQGDVSCYNSGLIHLYPMLGLGPPTRYVYLDTLVVFFPDRHPKFLEALKASGHRYVVTDLMCLRLNPEAIAGLCPEGPLQLAPRFPERLQRVYPWSQPAIYRAGRYLIHHVEHPLESLAPRERRQVKKEKEAAGEAAGLHPKRSSLKRD